MEENRYTLRYLPLFEQDLFEVVNYICNDLKNPSAATKLVNDVESAILKRMTNPTAFEPYPSIRKRSSLYYRIYVKNYTVFYTVIDDVIEIRRFLYNAMDLKERL